MVQLALDLVRPVDDHEAVLAQPARDLGFDRVGGAGMRTVESMRLTYGSSVGSLGEVPARHANDRIDVQLAFIEPEVAEIEPLGVPQQPRRLVVSGSDSIVQRGNPKDDAYPATLRAHAAAGRGGSRQGSLHTTQDRSGRPAGIRPVPLLYL
jgi:hypothetical protein